MNLLQDKFIVIGPYVGDIGTELMVFIPFLNWIKTTFNVGNMCISTHYDRTFLYNDTVVPIFKQYTNDVKSQGGHLHKKINAYDYQVLKKDVIENIVTMTNYRKSDMVSYDLGYSSYPNISLSQRVFLPFDNINYQNNNQIIYVLSKKKKNKPLYKYFKRDNNINIIDPDDFTYEDLIKKLLGSKVVITYSSYITFLCNLHHKRVFSWGPDITQYKSFYNFNNKNCVLVKTDKKLDLGF